MSAEGRTGWFAAQAHIVGSLESPETVFTWDGTVFARKSAAVGAGFKSFGSDDFNIGHLTNDALDWWGWMHEEHPPEDRGEVAEALGVTVAAVEVGP